MDKHVSAPASPSSPSQEDVPEGQTPPPNSNSVASHEPPSREALPSSQPPEQSSSPLVDLERHPKGKRKRTAAKDKAILEAAYHDNPKPDKAARLEIVKRVSLNEKEIQIWFQNRRQNDRRKSRPLSPQEIAALRYGGMQILSSDPALPYNTPANSTTANISPSQVESLTRPRPSSPAHSDPGAHRVDESVKEDKHAIGRPHNSPDGSTPGSSQEVNTTDDRFQLSRSFPGAVGYLSKRWNTGSSFSTPSTLGNRTGDEPIRLEPFSLSTSSSASTAPVLPAPSSQTTQFRLSLSLEGKAQVIESTTPPHLPPPRPSAESLAALAPVRRPGFHRSQSAHAAITLPPISSLTNSLPAPSAGALPPRLTRGRSRDVHAWQFACEAESQEDPLIAQAKHESSGSAVAAISLLRSTSSSSTSASPLQPSSSSKRNAAMSKVAPRSGAAKKAKLSRASSSVARLQTSFDGQKRIKLGAASGEKDDIADISKDKAKFSILASPSANDSDKENWSPDEEGNPHYRFSAGNTSSGSRRPLPSAAAQKPSQNPRRTTHGGRILQEHRGSLFASGSTTATVFNNSGRSRDAGKGNQARMEIFEDTSPRSAAAESLGAGVDAEVERFMRGEVSPSKKGDVDAVAGLLSLSQGNWR